MKPSEICCHWLEARLVDDCSGGNSRPLHPSGVGGGHFLIKKSDRRYEPHYGVEPTVPFLTLLRATAAVGSGAWEDQPPLAPFFGFKSRILIRSLVSFRCATFIFLFRWFVLCQ